VLFHFSCSPFYLPCSANEFSNNQPRTLKEYSEPIATDDGPSSSDRTSKMKEDSKAETFTVNSAVDEVGKKDR